MGSVFSSPKPPAPPPPPPPSTVRDEISGVEQVPVKNPDGTTTFVTRRLPMTEEQKAQKAEFEAIMKNSLEQIKLLSSGNYEHDAASQSVINAFEQQQRSLLDESFLSRSSEEEKLLARRGLSTSSAADAMRRQRRLDQQDALTNLGQQKDLLSSDIRNQQLGLQQNLYNIASGQENIEQARTFNLSMQGMGNAAAYDSANRASVLAGYQARLERANRPSMFSTALNSAIGGFTGGAGQSLGGDFGSYLGGAIGSAFGPAGAAVGSSLGRKAGQSL